MDVVRPQYNLGKFTFSVQQQNWHFNLVWSQFLVFKFVFLCSSGTMDAVFGVAQWQTFMFGKCVMPLFRFKCIASIWFHLISFHLVDLLLVYLMNSLISSLMSCISLSLSLNFSAYVSCVCVSVISIPFVIQHHSQWFIVSSDYVTEIDLTLLRLRHCRNFRLDSAKMHQMIVTISVNSSFACCTKRTDLNYLKWRVLRQNIVHLGLIVSAHVVIE